MTTSGIIICLLSSVLAVSAAVPQGLGEQVGHLPNSITICHSRFIKLPNTSLSF